MQEGDDNSSLRNVANACTRLDIMGNHKEKSEPIRFQETYDVDVSPSHGHPFTGQGRQEANAVCRVCQCIDVDKLGQAALQYFRIMAPDHAIYEKAIIIQKGKTKVDADHSSVERESLSPQLGKCSSSLDCLIELGCDCKGDLALVHYACALRWFVSRGSPTCEICGKPATNIRLSDLQMIISSLKERCHHNILRTGESTSDNTRLTSRSTRDGFEAVMWFDPNGHLLSGFSRDNNSSEQIDEFLNSVSPTTKWAVEGTGILIATGLLTVTISYLLSSKMDKTHKLGWRGLNILISAVCALAIVVFLRFGVLPRIRYGPARYWAVLVVFWFLIFGVWASSSRASPGST